MRTLPLIANGLILATSLVLAAPANAADASQFPAIGPQPDPSIVVEAETSTDRARMSVAFLQMAFNQKNVAQAFKLYVGPRYKQHSAVAPDGAEIFIKMVSEFLKHNNINYYVKRTVTDGDMVVVHSYQTQSSEDKPNEIHGFAEIDIFRFEQGKIAEHWSVHEQVPDSSANPNGLF